MQELRDRSHRLYRRVIEPHQFMTMIILVVFVAFGLVIVAMYLYNSSGAAQLDLSRPGFVAVRQQSVDKDANVNQDFPSTGKIDNEALDEFQKKLSLRSKKVIGSKSFENDVMSDEELGMFVTSNPATID